MSQIEITILKQGNRYKNVLSACFFTMADAYRKFDVYKSDLKKFLQSTKQINGFEIRLYTDDSGKDFVLDEVGDFPDVTVLHYDCPPFREGKGHTGAFGTIVRFLPLFEKGLDIVWISDIDLDRSIITLDIVEMMERNGADIFIPSAFCYQRKPWVGDVLKHPIQAGRFISKIKFSKQLLTNFIQRLIDGKYSELIKSINEYNRQKAPNDMFPYGMDEAFLNSSIYSSIRKHNVKVIVRKDFFTRNFLVYDIEGFPQEDIRVLDRYYKNPTHDLFKQVKQIYKKYVPMMLETRPCMQELLDRMSDFKKSFLIFLLLESNDL
jgi:hypothetical protein